MPYLSFYMCGPVVELWYGIVRSKASRLHVVCKKCWNLQHKNQPRNK